MADCLIIGEAIFIGRGAQFSGKAEHFRAPAFRAVRLL
jgi:hypothetical protein